MIIWDNTKVINGTPGTNVSINTTNINVSTSVAHTDIAAANIKVVASPYAADISASVINISNTSGGGNYITVQSNKIYVFSHTSQTTIGPGDVATNKITTYTVIPETNGMGSIGTPSSSYDTGYINNLTSNNISPITNNTGNIGSRATQYNHAYVNCISSGYHYNSSNDYVTTNIPLSLHLNDSINHGGAEDNNIRPYDVMDFLTLFFYSVDKQFLRYLYSEPHAGVNADNTSYNMQPLQSWEWSKRGLYLDFGTTTDTYAFLPLQMNLFAGNSEEPLSAMFSRDQMRGGTKEFIIPDILPVTFDANDLGDIQGDDYAIKYENGQHQLILPAGGPYLVSCSTGSRLPGFVSIYPASETQQTVHVDCTGDIIVWRRGYWPAWRGSTGSSTGPEHLYAWNRGTVNWLNFWKAGY